MERRAAPPLEWAFVARDQELEVIAHARRDGARAVIIGGSSGVGKTRLARAAAADAADDGWRIDWAIGTQAARDLPLGAFLHLVPDDRGARGEALLGAIVDALVARDKSEPTFLVIDDAHLLDEASATLVHRLVMTERAFVVLTLRTGEHPVDAIRLLWRDDTSRRVELGPFDADATRELASSLLGGAVDTTTAQLIWETTRGNALHVRELVRDGLRRETLTTRDDRWHWEGPIVAPPSLAELVGARVEQLDDDARCALEVVATCEPIGVAVLQQLVSGDAIATLEHDALAEVSIEGRRRIVRCAHPLHGEVVREQLAFTRADSIRRLFADALDRTGAHRGDDVLRLAQLRLDTGETNDTELLRLAARRAWVVGHLDLLVRCCDAIRYAGPDPEVEYLLGEVSVDRGEAGDALARWAPLADADCDDELRAQIAKARAQVLAYVFGRTDEAKQVLDAAIAALQEPDLRALLRAARTSFDLHATVEDNDDAPSDEAAVLTWLTSARLRLVAGACDDVADDPTPIEDVARRGSTGFPLALTFVQILRFFAYLGGARFDAALALARNGLGTSVGDERRWARTYWIQGHGLVALDRGRPHEAVPYLEEAAAAMRGNDNGGLRNVLSELATARAQTGDTKGARAALEEMDQANVGATGAYISEARARAATLAAEGHASAAADVLAVDARQAMDDDLALYELLARHDACRYGRPREHAQRLVDVAAGMQGPLPSAFAGFGAALAAEDASALVAAAEEFERCGCGLYAAEAMTAAARAGRVEGRPDAFALADRAAALASAADHPHTPLLAGGAQTAPLTGREREVAMLAARGLTDREIAFELTISVRTVNAHLRSVYAKLGINSRADLASSWGGV